jgi:hypothetical protein
VRRGRRQHAVYNYAKKNSNYRKRRIYVPWGQNHTHLAPRIESEEIFWLLLLEIMY